MTTAIIHLSDLHFRDNWPEGHNLLLENLFRDLSKQLTQLGSSNVYLAFTGDVVVSGERIADYQKLLELLDAKLNSIGIPKAKRICVPGNHDASRGEIQNLFFEHNGIIRQGLNEKGFNDYIATSPATLFQKFDNYVNFESNFAQYGVTKQSISGRGWTLGHDIGIYCLNTALCSSAGLSDINGDIIVDKNSLSVCTRNLHKWNQECQARWKILLMHHPLDHLTSWARNEITSILNADFVLCLSGHTHDQDNLRSINNHGSLIQCSAPALFTDKYDRLGYSIITICPTKGVSTIIYRQWSSKFHSFVTGSIFSGTDTGKIELHKDQTFAIEPQQANSIESDFIDRINTDKLEKALVSYSSQPKIWIQPLLHLNQETVSDRNIDPPIDLLEFVSNPYSAFINAPPQYGLTCLALYLVREAWRHPNKSFWLYLDLKQIDHQIRQLDNYIETELKFLGQGKESIKSIIIDSWDSTEKYSLKILETISKNHPGIPIIIMQAFDSTQMPGLNQDPELPQQFSHLYLWSLSRERIRILVSQYNSVKHIGDEDALLKRVISDLDALNIHRTPLNCITLLKVSEVDFDESPVNRTEMIKRVLFLLFSLNEIPTYKSKPDLKDCEYVLGYFCETLLRENTYQFTRENFIKKTNDFCQMRMIDLEVQVLFDVLHSNNIIIQSNDHFGFKFKYWILYFAAQRMYHDPDFARFIFDGMRYAKYPEIIEFYTGTDRKRENALKQLIIDLRKASQTVRDKSGIPEDLNPYRIAQWKPSDSTLNQMHDEICNGVMESNLPVEIKDRFADRNYDRSKPYNQNIQEILSEYAFVFMTQTMVAASKALRNSDYVEPQIKQELLVEILKAWGQISNILLILLPVLSEKGTASFGGAGFFLDGDFGDTVEKRFQTILSVIPYNIVTWHQDDLFSQKMGPLLIHQLSKESNDLISHFLILIMIYNRPRNWKAQVEQYITNINKNSFYLLGIYKALRGQYRYSYASPKSLANIEYLIKMANAKHTLGIKTPGIKVINKASDKLLPPREVDN